VLRVLVVILGGNSIVTSRCFLRQREVPLVYLERASPDSLAWAMSIEGVNGGAKAGHCGGVKVGQSQCEWSR
jgi:hypothetical protein